MVSVLATDRVTVKVADAVPVFPSVTAASPIRSAGVSGGQSALLRTTATAYPTTPSTE